MSEVAVPRPGRSARGRALTPGAVLSSALLVVLGIVVLLPLGFVAYGALADAPPHTAGSSFTLANLAAVYVSGNFVEPFLTTLGIGLATGMVSTAVGLALAWVITRLDIPAPAMWTRLLAIPLYFSPLMLAFAFMALGAPRVGLLNQAWQALGGTGSLANVYNFAGIVFVLTVHYAPYALIVLVGPVRAVSSELEEAALVLGSSRLQVARHVVLPLLWPAIFSAALMVATMAAENFAVPTLLGRETHIRTIPGEIYYMLSSEPTSPNLAAAAGTLLLLLTSAGVLGYRWMTRLAGRYTAVTGKPKPMTRTKLGRWRWVVVAGLGLYLAVTTVLPIAALVFGSFLRFLGRRFDLNLLTLRNYEAALRPANLQALGNSVLLAIMAATICVVLGFLVSFCIRRTKAPFRATLDYISALPVAIPGMVLGIGMLWAYAGAPWGLWSSIWVLLLAYVARFVVHPVRAAGTALLQVSHDMDEAAQVLGASMTRRMWDISAPVTRVSLLSSWLVVAIFVLNEVTATVLLYSSRSVTLSVLTWTSLDSVGAMQAFAFAVLQAAITAALVGVSYALAGKDRT